MSKSVESDFNKNSNNFETINNTLDMCESYKYELNIKKIEFFKLIKNYLCSIYIDKLSNELDLDKNEILNLLSEEKYAEPFLNGENYFGDTAISIIRQYAKTLNIETIDALKIIFKNKSALLFLEGEKGLMIHNEKDNLRVLIKATLFRTHKFFRPIEPKEKLLIRKFYKFKLIEKKSLEIWAEY